MRTPRGRVADVLDRENCWDHFDCGRGPAGPGAHESDVCRAALEDAADGINGGVKGGRSCWAVAGTLGVDQLECLVRDRCTECEFRLAVIKQEMPHFDDRYPVLERLGYASALTLSDRVEIVADEQPADPSGSVTVLPE